MIDFPTNTESIYIPPHDEAACLALLEYEKACRSAEASKFGLPGMNYTKILSMQYYARLYETTVPAMRQHWECINRLLGSDPLSKYDLCDPTPERG